MEQTHSDKPMNWKDCNDLVQRVLTDPEVIKRFGEKRVRVEFTNGQAGRASYRGGPHIRLGKWSRQPHVLLHETAHHLATLYAGHGPHFAYTCLWVTQRFMGEAAGEELKQSYRDNGVRVQAMDKYAQHHSQELPKQVRGKLVPKVWEQHSADIDYRVPVAAAKPSTTPQAAGSKVCDVDGCKNVKRRGTKCWKHREEV